MTLYEEFYKSVVTDKMSPLKILFVTSRVEYMKWLESNCVSLSSILSRKKKTKKAYKKIRHTTEFESQVILLGIIGELDSIIYEIQDKDVARKKI